MFDRELPETISIAGYNFREIAKENLLNSVFSSVSIQSDVSSK
ncbi:hypothetical protein VB796_05195 [Arcicella sp. LKC2W]|nr:hypothetical protein [Arcicella sp. LKC2W]MEA5458421.1 hypothetical protein [Arcicella sp. LKC2W]